MSIWHVAKCSIVYHRDLFWWKCIFDSYADCVGPWSDCAPAQSDQGLCSPLTEPLFSDECINGWWSPGWDCAHAQDWLNLRISHKLKDTFSLVASHIRNYFNRFYVWRWWFFRGVLQMGPNTWRLQLKCPGLTGKAYTILHASGPHSGQVLQRALFETLFLFFLFFSNILFMREQRRHWPESAPVSASNWTGSSACIIWSVSLFSIFWASKVWDSVHVLFAGSGPDQLTYSHGLISAVIVCRQNHWEGNNSTNVSRTVSLWV